MSSARRVPLLALVGFALLASPVGAQETRGPQGDAPLPVCERPARPQRPPGVPPSAEELAEARKRWEALGPEQRAQLAERYRRFQALGEDARRELQERADNLGRLEELLCRRLSEGERARLERLPPPQRAEVMREMVRSELETQGERVLLHLPVDVRERLANATEADRLRHFQQYKLAIRERLSANAVRALGQELELPKEEVQRLLALPDPERIDAALELGKRLGRREVERSGLPKGLTFERWRQIEALPPEEFYHEIARLSDGLRRPPPPHAEAPHPGFELRRALRPSREAILEHAELPPEERVRAIRTSQRPRLTELVRQSGLLDAEQMSQLEALPDGAFYAQVRRIAHERGSRSGAGGPHERRFDGRRGPDPFPGRDAGPRRERHEGARPQPPPPAPRPRPRDGR